MRRRPCRHLPGCGVALAAALAACALPPQPVPDAGTEYNDVPYEGAAFPNRRTSLPSPPDGVAIVTNTMSDTLAVIDLTTREPIRTLPVGRDPLGVDGPAGLVVASADLFVPLSYPVPFSGAHAGHTGHGKPPGYVQRLARDDLRILGETAIDTEPTAVALSEDGKRLVVAHFFQAGLDAAAKDLAQLDLARARLTVLDPTRVGDSDGPEPPTVRVCLGASGVALSRPDAARAYVACAGEDSVAVVDLTDLAAPISRVPLGADAGPPAEPKLAPFASVLSPGGDTLAVTTRLSRDVRLLQVGRQTVAPGATVPLGATPRLPAFSADGTVLYVPVRDPDALVSVDVVGAMVLGVRDFGAGECVAPTQIVVRGRDAMLVLCAGSAAAPGRVVMLDPVTLALEASADVGLSPSAIGVP